MDWRRTPQAVDARFNRRGVLAGLAVVSAIPSLTGCVAAESMRHRPGLAITIDDFDLGDTPLLTGEARDEAIRRALAGHDIKAAAFPDGRKFQADAMARVLPRWSEGGHIIGNHSFSHRSFDNADPAEFMADILRLEPLLKPYLGFQKLFRFPYLAEGKNAERRDRLRVLLRENGYRIAPVTLDTSDWFFDNRLRARLKSDPKADIAPYRKAYLEHIWERAVYYDALARDLFGHSLDHTILLHHRLTTALFLPALLDMFQERGWRLVDASTALAASELNRSYDTLPAGQSLVWAAAKAHGGFESRLRYPGEDGAYEAPHMDALGL